MKTSAQILVIIAALLVLGLLTIVLAGYVGLVVSAAYNAFLWGWDAV